MDSCAISPPALLFQIQYLMIIIDDAKEKLQQLNLKKDQLSDPEFQDRFQEISSQLEKANKEKDSCAEIQKVLQISTAQGKILTEEANEIRKSKVLKIISGWQHILNYIFYVVFILNIFITGLGLTGSTNQ